MGSNSPGEDMGDIRILRKELRFVVDGAQNSPAIVSEVEGIFGNCCRFISLFIMFDDAGAVAIFGFKLLFLCF